MTLPVMHPAKRRRLDQSTAALSRPFRSPLRVDVKKQSSTAILDRSQSSTDPDAHPAQPASSPARKTPASTTTWPPSSQSSPAKAVTTGNTTTASASPTRPTSRPLRPPHPALGSRKSQSPEYLALQKQHTRLLTEISALRKSLDTTHQALSLESSNQDTELERLISKWRGIAREAAEELFRVARDKVDRMGGVGAWRDRTYRRNEAWGDEVPQGLHEEIDEDNLTAEQKDALVQMREEAEREKEKYGALVVQDGPKAEKEERDDESFTMDMMLRQLNVEMDVIGFDVRNQRWVD